MKYLDPADLRVRTVGRSTNGRKRYRVTFLGRVLVTGTRAQVYRALRRRLREPEALSDAFRRSA